MVLFRRVIIPKASLFWRFWSWKVIIPNSKFQKPFRLKTSWNYKGPVHNHLLGGPDAKEGDPMGTDQFLNQISMLIFGWEIVDFETMINQKSTSQPQFNQKSTNCQPNFNHFSTLTFQLQTWLIFGWIVVKKLIFGWSLFQNQRFLNQISTLRMVEESWGSTLNQRWFNIEKLICAHWGSLTSLNPGRGENHKFSLVRENLVYYSAGAAAGLPYVTRFFLLSNTPFSHTVLLFIKGRGRNQILS